MTEKIGLSKVLDSIVADVMRYGMAAYALMRVDGDIEIVTCKGTLPELVTKIGRNSLAAETDAGDWDISKLSEEESALLHASWLDGQRNPDMAVADQATAAAYLAGTEGGMSMWYLVSRHFELDGKQCVIPLPTDTEFELIHMFGLAGLIADYVLVAQSPNQGCA